MALLPSSRWLLLPLLAAALSVAPDAWAMAAVALARRRLKEFWRVLPAKTRSFMPLIATQGGAGFLLCFSGGG